MRDVVPKPGAMQFENSPMDADMGSYSPQQSYSLRYHEEDDCVGSRAVLAEVQVSAMHATRFTQWMSAEACL